MKRLIYVTTQHFAAPVVGREAVQQVISKDPELFRKTVLAVLEQKKGHLGVAHPIRPTTIAR